MPSGEPVAHSVAALRQGLLLDYRLVAGQGDFRMAASCGIVFAEALLGRDGRVCAQPGAWYPRRCSRLTGWRRPCAGRESMSRRPATIGWAQPPSADQTEHVHALPSAARVLPEPAGPVSHAPRLRPAKRASDRGHRAATPRCLRE
jgi:hypothetical protein